MPRLYLVNDSYPELREIRKQWSRTATWMRAIGHATRCRDFWFFVGVQAACIAAFTGVGIAAALLLRLNDRQAGILGTVLTVLAMALFSYLQASWGGDMMRSHLRAVSDTARYACPACGQSLLGHLDSEEAEVRCAECGAIVGREVFDPPYPIPREFRVFPPWRKTKMV